MYASTSAPIGRSWTPSRVALVGAALFAGLAGACGGGISGGGQSGIPGEEGPKPGGGFFFVDENQSGGASKVHLAQVIWGRLVDVYETANGQTVSDPVFRDFVIEQSVLSNGSTYVLERNPVTERERLIIKAQKRGVGVDSTQFDQLLAAATDALPTVVPKNDNGTSSPPFTTVPRNACISLRFDDCLADDTTAAQNLINTVRVITGYPPAIPFSARVVFDPNHGAVLGGNFHSTRVLVDLTTSESEAAALPVPVGVNPIGLPASLTTSDQTNVSVRVPTQVDLGSGQFQVLTNLAGNPMDVNSDGPVDPNSPTFDVVRAIQSGNSEDPSNGFLLDVDKPRVIGGWPVSVTASADDGAGTSGLDFVLGITFTTTCLSAPAVGDVIKVGDAFLEVTEANVLSGSDVSGLKVRSASPVTKPNGDPDPDALKGTGVYEAPFLAALGLAEGCWVDFVPGAGTFPTTDVSTTAQVLARFSEPMDPASLSPFGSFLIVQGAAGASSTANTNNIVVGQVLPNNDLTQFTFNPSLPFAHPVGEALHVELHGPRDLAGNQLRQEIPFVDFTLNPLNASQNNDALVLRFESNDEYGPNSGGPDGLIDLRGQFFYDGAGGVRPRPVSVTGWPADRTNPVPQLMLPLTTGLLTPLTPLGAKVQMLWRYCDVGWDVTDETKYNLDVMGLSWSPVGGQVVADFYELFEMRLGHSRFLPDEIPSSPVIPGAPGHPNSGLPGSTGPYENNYLADSNPTVVHNRALGYTVNPADLFSSTTQTLMMPYPLNRGLNPIVTYTWRDTAILTKGADGDPLQKGIPLEIEGNCAACAKVTTLAPGSIAPAGAVPTFGLPLLMEFRCYPADSGIGLNVFDVSLANAVSVTPNFRAYSAGGINTAGQQTIVLPDREITPSGGFNPLSTPPGKKTNTVADNSFYIGQLDTVVRVSRIHTAWLDSGQSVVPTWQTPLMEPASGDPAGTAVLLDFRSATGFSGGGNAQFNAAALDVYGDEKSPAPLFASGPSWSDDISIASGARYLQVRITFVNNIATGLSPELRALALPYLVQ